jgi:hypothetical protein
MSNYPEPRLPIAFGVLDLFDYLIPSANLMLGRIHTSPQLRQNKIIDPRIESLRLIDDQRLVLICALRRDDLRGRCT